MRSSLETHRSFLTVYPGGKSDLTDMVCYKRLLYMAGFLRPSATTSGWTTFQQATVTLKFNMASKMAAIFVNIHSLLSLLLHFHV